MTDPAANGNLYCREHLFNGTTDNKSTLDMSGVYEIVCIPTGKRYVGSTASSFKRRFSQHKYALSRYRYNPILVNAWKKHGPDAFVFRPLIVCRPEDVLFYEQLVIDALCPELNICRTAGNCLGVKHSEKTRENARNRANKHWAEGRLSKDRLREVAKKRARRYEIHGETLTIMEMAGKYGISKTTIEQRIRGGYIGNDLVAPVGSLVDRYEVNGEKLSVKEISDKYEIAQETILWRIKRGAVGVDIIADVRESNRKYLFENEYLTISEIASRYNVSRQNVAYRIKQGYSGLDLVRSGIRRKDQCLFDGSYLSVKEISERFNVPYRVVWGRAKSGKTGRDLVAEPGSLRPKYMVFGEMLTESEIAKKYSLKRTTVHMRLSKGWRDNKLVAPVSGDRRNDA